MDTDTGIFTAPMGGTYLFVFHIATHDNKKALLSIRLNGEEVASVFDQVTLSKHLKNFQNTFKPLSKHFQSTLKTLSKPFQKHFKTISKHFRSAFKALSKQALNVRGRSTITCTSTLNV